MLWHFTEHAVYLDGKGNLAPWLPNRYKIGDLLEALSAIVILPEDLEQLGWLDGRESGPIVATSNGLLDIASLKLHLHKILVMVGPTRGGKGVIARILTALIGKRNVCGPTLNSLGGEFGLAPLLGKSVAAISDARSGGGKNSAVVVERLLSISGEDTLTCNRKYKEQWSGKLPVRLHIISNELPRLGDASSASGRAAWRRQPRRVVPPHVQVSTGRCPSNRSPSIATQACGLWDR
jgi:hypothetical protein